MGYCLQLEDNKCHLSLLSVVQRGKNIDHLRWPPLSEVRIWSSKEFWWGELLKSFKGSILALYIVTRVSRLRIRVLSLVFHYMG